MRSNCSNSNLKFAAFIRVSTEKQAEQGASLRVQKKEIKEAVQELGGKIVKWYGGQESATPGSDKKQLNELLAEASRNNCMFNAVIVAHHDRWSRDNRKSEEGLECFLENGIRFFVCDDEQDLNDPTCRLHLTMSVAIGQFHARTQAKKSIKSRIYRARQGIPVGGKLPYGREYDSRAGVWKIKEDAQKLILEVANRFIAGESMSALAAEKGMNNSNLHKILTKRAGTEWSQSFYSKALNIDEKIPTTIPALLPDKIIKAIKKRIDENITYKRGPNREESPYLLSGRIFCEHCGYALFGQKNHGERLYYRHAHTKRIKECDVEKTWVSAEKIESRVMEELFEVLGNPIELKRAIEKATPNLERIKELEQEEKTLLKDLKKKDSGRKKILTLIGLDVLSAESAADQLAKIKKAEGKLMERLAGVQSYLDNVPTKKSIEKVSKIVSKKYGTLRYPSHTQMRLVSTKRLLNSDITLMTRADRRELLKRLFDGKRPDGRKCGVYIRWVKASGKKKPSWRYSIHGMFYQSEEIAVKKAAVKSASYSRAQDLP